MGKLMHNTQIKHSSHAHLLQLSSNRHLQTPINCTGCNLHISPTDDVYNCKPCNFFLHQSCSKFPQLITHPSHREHTLSLLPTPIYPGGFFRCDACTHQGTRFSYHCHYCDFDLHVLCASKPLSVNHTFHSHPLVLTFSSPYGEKVGFSCDVCQNIGACDEWLYRCVACEFDVHLHCATNKMLQHNHSFPGSSSVNHSMVAGQPLAHSMSTGHVQTNWQPQNGGGYQQPQQQPPAVGVQSYQMQLQNGAPAAGGYNQQPQQQPPAVGVQSYQMQQQNGGGYQQPQQPPAVGYQMQPQGNQNVGANGNNGLGDVIVTGFVEGVMQQLGQNFVQSLTGGDGGGGGNGGGDGGGDGGNNDYECSTYE